MPALTKYRLEAFYVDYLSLSRSSEIGIRFTENFKGIVKRL